MLNEKNIIVCLGQSGSCINLIRNLILLDSTVHWPIDVGITDKINYLKSNVYNVSDINHWLKHEIKIRNTYFDLTKLEQLESEEILNLAKTSKICLLSHSYKLVFEAVKKYPEIKIISSYADSLHSLKWQLRSSIEKLGGLEKLYNYIDIDKNAFLDKYTIEEYYQKNVTTMYNEFIKQTKYIESIGRCKIPLSSILNCEVNKIVSSLNNFCDLNLTFDQVHEIMDCWQKLHWDLDDTDNYYVFKKYLNLNKENND